MVGFLAGRDVVEPPEFMRTLRAALTGWEPPPGWEARSRWGSTFLALEGSTTRVPVAREGAGGGLTSFGTSVLVLTHEGRIFFARSADGGVHELPLEPPDNGFMEYRRAAEERFADLTHDFPSFRYNDILHYRSGEHHGLAVSYTEFVDEEDCYRTAIAVLRLPPDIVEPERIEEVSQGWDVLHRTRPCLPLKDTWQAIEGHMAGGRLAFRPPSTIYLASGDYAWDGSYAPEVLAQDETNDYGKVLAVDLSSGAPTVVSVGHRNPQGIALDTAGRLWVAEHGPRGGDELNLIVEGANYGWPLEALGVQYSGLPLPRAPNPGRHDRFTRPVYAWLPSVAASSLTALRDFDPAWDGDLLMGTLRSGNLVRIRVRGDRVLFAETIPFGPRIRYVHQHRDGRLVVFTDDHHLAFLRPADRSEVARFVDDFIAAQPDSLGNELRAAVAACQECHSLEPGFDQTAPNLFSVFGARVASTPFEGYSAALRQRGGRWSREALTDYLDDPASFAPGTTMPDPDLDDPRIVAALIDLLASLRQTVE